jgi:hypothetical protein
MAIPRMPARSQPRDLVCRQLRRSQSPAADIGLGRFDGGALLPGLRKAQESRAFGIAQLTSSSCIPALNTDVAGVANCRAINDKVLAIAREIRPEIVLLHSTWDRYLDGLAETVAALKNRPTLASLCWARFRGGNAGCQTR